MTEEKCSMKDCLCSKDAFKAVVLGLLVITFILSVVNFISLNNYKNKIETKLEAMVVEGIDKNPKAILDSVQKFLIAQEEEANKSREAKMATVASRKADIQAINYAGVVNKNGKITVVEFFDYNCGYCKAATAAVNKLASENKNVRVIYKDLPILGPSSIYAAKVAIAINIIAPEKFAAYHDYLMLEGEARSEAGVNDAVTKAKIKLSLIQDTLKKESAKIDKVLQDNLTLANDIGINGTPAFVIEDELIPGALDYNSLVEIVNRKSK